MAANLSTETSSEDYFDEEMDKLITSLTPDVEQIIPQTKETFSCPFCSKLCISKGGLTRHKRSKHRDLLPPEGLPTPSNPADKKIAEQILSPDTFKRLVQKSAVKLSVDECYPVDILSKFKIFIISPLSLQDVMPCYELIKPLILKFNGDAEKFYPLFYKLFEKNQPFIGLDYHCTLLLGFELANQILAELTNAEISIDGQSIIFDKSFAEMDERQKSIISYLSGYIVGTFYRRINLVNL